MTAELRVSSRYQLRQITSSTSRIISFGPNIVYTQIQLGTEGFRGRCQYRAIVKAQHVIMEIVSTNSTERHHGK